MSYNRFLLIHKFFHMSNNKTADKRDLIYKVRPLIELQNSISKKYNVPGRCLNIDEAMIKFKGRLKFRQFICNKPVKYGIKCFLLCNSKTSYCYTIIVYTGKGTVPLLPGMSSVESLIAQMMTPYVNEFRELFVDNYYNTINLSYYFLEKKTGLIGTLRKNRGRSDKKLNFPKLPGFDVYLDEKKSVCMVYVKDRNEFIVTTNINFPRPVESINRRNERKDTLDLLDKYNYFARGVDLCNQKCTMFRYEHPNKKWWRPLCFHVIQVLLHNAFIIYRNLKGSLTYKNFYKSVINSLLDKQMQVDTRKSFHRINYISPMKKEVTSGSCSMCKKMTIFRCTKCKIRLCIPECYNIYHTKIR